MKANPRETLCRAIAGVGAGEERGGGGMSFLRVEENGPTIRLLRVLGVVCEQYMLQPGELLRGGRARRVAWPRQLVIHVARSKGVDTDVIVRLMRVSRTYIPYAVSQVQDRCQAEPGYAAELAEVSAKVDEVDHVMARREAVCHD